jgi:hypothetical protein
MKSMTGGLEIPGLDQALGKLLHGGDPEPPPEPNEPRQSS